jgi:hypothetical protein
MHAHFAVIADTAARARSRAAATAFAATAFAATALAATTLLGGCTSDPRAPARFPDDWMGHWSGTLEMHGAQPSEGEVRMELVIGPSIAADRLASRPAGEWNHVRIQARGPRVIIHLNGFQIIDHEPVRSLRGYIGLQNHDNKAVTWFRNIHLTEL